MKDQLSGKLKDFVAADVATKFTAELDKHYNWLYDEGVHAKKTEYASRLEQLKAFGEPITRRYNDFNNTPEALQELERSVSQVDKFSQTTVINMINLFFRRKNMLTSLHKKEPRSPKSAITP